MIFDKLFSLAPKCYFAYDKDRDDEKRSSKGVSKRFRLTYDDYKDVLYKNKVVRTTNTSIRLFRGEMVTLKQEKSGLTNKLTKSFVHDDKITVSPFEKFK